MRLLAPPGRGRQLYLPHSINVPRNRLASTGGAAAYRGCGPLVPSQVHPLQFRPLGRAASHSQPSAQAPGPWHTPSSPAAALRSHGCRNLQLHRGDGPRRARPPGGARWVRGAARAGNCCGCGVCRSDLPGGPALVLLGKGRGVGVVGFRPLSPPRPPHAPCSAPERKVSVLSELRSVHAREGDGATFECTLSEVETTGNWELGGRPLRPGGRIRIRQEGLADFLPTLAPRCAAPSSDRPRPTRISPTSSSNGPAPRPKERSLGLFLDPCSGPSSQTASSPLASQFRPAPLSFTASEPTRGPTLAPPSSPNSHQRRLWPR